MERRFTIAIGKTGGKSAQENALQKDDKPEEKSSVAQRTLGAMNAEVYHEKNKSTIRIPGFKYDDFDQAGKLDIVKCCRLMHASMVYAFPWLRELSDAKRGDLALFVVANHYVVSRHLHDRAAVDCPMLLSWWPAGVGRSSVDIATSLREESSGKLLASNRLRLVLVDGTTQKSVPLSGNVRRQAKAECSDGDCQFPAFRLDQSAFPTCRTFPVDVRVPFVDNDQLDHVTQAGYAVFVRECAAQATAAGFYGRVAGDFARYAVESLTMVHTGEAFAGDELRVETWEDPNNPLQLFFAVNRRKQTVCYARMLLLDMLRSNL